MTSGFFLDVTITPARSLSKRGRLVVLGITLALAIVPVTVFTLMGAPFVLPFMGLDVAGLALALWWINRKVPAEQVRVSREIIEVFRDGEEVWRSQVTFTQINVYETGVRLTARGKTYVLGGALAPLERAEFSAAFQLAVIAAKAGGSASPRRARAPS